MQDPYYGHRDIFTGEPIRDKDEWIEWDYVLVTAVQIIEDHTDKHGSLIWEVEAERVYVDAEKRIDKFQAAVDSRTKGTKQKGYTPSPGEYFVPKLDLRGGEWPTWEEYRQSFAEAGTIEE